MGNGAKVNTTTGDYDNPGSCSEGDILSLMVEGLYPRRPLSVSVIDGSGNRIGHIKEIEESEIFDLLNMPGVTITCVALESSSSREFVSSARRGVKIRVTVSCRDDNRLQAIVV